MTKQTDKKMNLPLILTVYLLGIFMGALDTGIVTPARTIIQESLRVDDKLGIWMITIYTLAYAASIPVMGKLADRMGRRTVYLVSIFLFGFGSLLCGVSHSMGSFTMLLVTRAIQAIGGGGIVPIANAEFGTTFPEEKRGMALGMVGGVYGIANIFGASAGSAILDIFGVDKWEFIFYVNVPIAVFIVIAGFFALPNTKEKSDKPIDGAGICVLVIMVLSLMYGIKNIDFFNFVETITDPGVYGYLLGFVVLLPIFIFIEKKAVDPVMNLKYFTNMRIVMTLLITIISGIVLMGVIFVPQFCENALKVSSGSGGYFVIILGLCAGVGAMSSGKLTDKYGPKLVLAIGFVAAVIAALIVVFFSSVNPNKVNVFASLIFIGLGIGFTMGAPLNYMMLGEVDEREANSALATLSLVRSLGTVVAPAIMVGFIANAGAGMMDNVMGVLPNEIKVPELPYAEELMQEMKDQGVEGMPDLSEMTTVKFDMESTDSSDMDVEIPDDIIDELKSSDVTTITDSVKKMATVMFDQMSPQIQDKINNGINEGIDGVSSGINSMNSAVSKMNKARSGMQQGIDGMSQALKSQNAERDCMIAKRDQMDEVIRQMQAALDAMGGHNPELEEQIEKLTAARNGIQSGIDGISQGIDSVTKKRSNLINSRKKMGTAISGIKTGIYEATDSRNKMIALRDAVPGAFEAAKADYLDEIEAKRGDIEDVYQSSLNVGFRQIFLMTAIGSMIGLLVLGIYRIRDRKTA